MHGSRVGALQMKVGDVSGASGGYTITLWCVVRASSAGESHDAELEDLY